MEALRPEWSEEELSLPKADLVEAPLEPESESAQALSFAGGKLATEAMKKLPEVKQLHVEEAARRGDAVELDYERRQEVRDEPGASAPAATPDDQAAKYATSVASVIAGLPYQQQPRQATPEQAEPLPQRRPAAGYGLYSQAIRTGFIAGLMIAFTVILLLIIT